MVHDRLHDFRVFVAVADRGSLAAAAAVLHRTPSAVSKSLAHLEERLGVVLLERTTRSARLTEAGRRLLPAARDLVGRAEAIAELMAGGDGEPRGVLRVSAMAVATDARVLRCIGLLRQRWPRLVVQLVQTERMPDVAAGEADVVLRIGEVARPGLHGVRLAPSHRRIVAAPAYLRRLGTPQSPDELSQHTLLGYTAQPELNLWELKRGSKRFTLAVEPGFAANSAALVRQAALAGVGIARLSSLLVADDLATGRLVALLEPFTVAGGQHLCAVVSERGVRSPAAQALLELLQSAFDRPA